MIVFHCETFEMNFSPNISESRAVLTLLISDIAQQLDISSSRPVGIRYGDYVVAL